MTHALIGDRRGSVSHFCELGEPKTLLHYKPTTVLMPAWGSGPKPRYGAKVSWCCSTNCLSRRGWWLMGRKGKISDIQDCIPFSGLGPTVRPQTCGCRWLLPKKSAATGLKEKARMWQPGNSRPDLLTGYIHFHLPIYKVMRSLHYPLPTPMKLFPRQASTRTQSEDGGRYQCRHRSGCRSTIEPECRALNQILYFSLELSGFAGAI